MSTHITRRRLIGVGGAVALGVLTGCSTAATPSAPPASGPNVTPSAGSGGKGGAKKFNLTIMGNQGEVDKDELATFLADKDFGVTWVKEDPTTLNAMLAAGNPPDLVRDPGAMVAAYIAHKGLATPLDDYVAKSSVIKKDDLQPANDAWRFDGTTQGKGPLYGIAKDFSQDSQWWLRTDMSEAAGVKAPTNDKPWSYADLAENCAKMTKKSGNRIVQYGMFEIGPSMKLLQYMLSTHGGSMFTPDYKKVDLGTPEAQSAIQWLLDTAVARVGYSPVDPNPDGYDWTAMTANRLASSGFGYWFQGQLQDKGADKWRDKCLLMPSLSFGPQRKSATYSATGMWIPQKAKHKDEAFAFLEFHTGGADAKKRAASGWGIPALKSLESLVPTSTSFQKKALESYQSDVKYAQVLSFSPFAQTSALDTVLGQEFLTVAKGSKKAVDFAAAVSPKINALLERGAR